MARIALGSNVKEGPRRGKVVGHRPKGMVDVQFADVEWVERRQESNLRRGNPYPDTKKPSKEQFRRQQMAIYQSQKERGLSDGEAWSSSFAIATGVGQKHGWLKPGTQEPTAKGRRGSKQKLKTPDAWAKEQQYELGLGRHRKSGKFRVAPTRHGSQLRYYVQPGGQYFHGKGAKKRAETLRDDLNGVSMPKRLAMAANPQEYELRENWLPAVAAALTVADVGYRAVRDRKKKKEKKKENPRYLDERGGMKRGLADLRREARNRLATANTLGTEKGNLLVELSRVPRTERKAHREKRASLDKRIDHVEHLFYTLKSQVQDEIDTNYYGRLTREQSVGLRALQREYQGAAREVQEATKKKSAARKTRKSKANPKMYAGIHKIGYYWATVRSAKPGDYVAPMILADHDPATGKKVYYFAFESKNKRRITALEQAARQAGLRSTSMRNELEGSYKQRQRGQEPIYIFKTTSLKAVQQLAILLNRKDIGYKVEPQALFRQLARASMPAPKARKPTGLEHKSMAELAAQRKALLARKAKRANPSGNGPITRKADLKRDEQYTIWLKMVSGTFVVERSYPGSYIQDAMWTDIKAYNRQNKRQYVVVEQGIDPNTGYRQNFVGSLVRGGVALIKTPLGKAIITETAVVAAVMIGDKLVQKGKISPKVMSYVQGRVEQKTGVKPSQAEVTKVLSAMDKNKDKTLTDAEVIEALELIQKGKTKTNRRR
jgi:hypothetical protein